MGRNHGVEEAGGFSRQRSHSIQESHIVVGAELELMLLPEVVDQHEFGGAGAR